MESGDKSPHSKWQSRAKEVPFGRVPCPTALPLPAKINSVSNRICGNVSEIGRVFVALPSSTNCVLFGKSFVTEPFKGSVFFARRRIFRTARSNSITNSDSSAPGMRRENSRASVSDRQLPRRIPDPTNWFLQLASRPFSAMTVTN